MTLDSSPPSSPGIDKKSSWARKNPGTCDNRPYRHGVGMMVFNDPKEIFMGRRLDFPQGAWQLPQGGLNPGEDPIKAALRELYEETGMETVEMVAESKHWYHYDFPGALSRRIWGGQFKGQTQKWFLMRFQGAEEEIRLNLHHDPEFCQWRWVPYETIPHEAISFKRPLYRHLIKEFQGALHNN